MKTEQIKTGIKSSIQAFANKNLTTNALSFFKTLGYATERQAPFHKKTKEEFADTFLSPEKKFDKIKAKFSDWNYVDLLFQLSKEELQKQVSLFDTRKVDNTIIETYLFFAIQLTNKEYSRTELSLITREINRLFPMPVMVLFRHENTLTLSVINRRLHKLDDTKDVLEKITLIKDINIENPHRAHIEILFDLSFEELKEKYQFVNFVDLHNSWQKTLDTKELNKRFFNELANWYFWATSKVVFPDDELKDKDIRNATGVIRLITRLMFVWFLKEKNLVPDDLFNEKKLKQLLKFTDENKSTYYKAILQNLFFATLNTEMGKRKFRGAADKSQNDHYFIHNLFCYEKEFINPKEALEKYFGPVPFLNGGLFECLDKQVEISGKPKPIRIDGFSDRNDNTLKVPDELFFTTKENIIDLSNVYGTPKKSKEKVRGLIDILDSYKFTITENTPIEEEIALDPELLGKVFENLLANYNPETQTTARKQTGSFYTPREIVNYMVDESLIAYLKQQGNNEAFEANLRVLLSYSKNTNPFSKKETENLIQAIDNIKIIDPACGSGAFPMGILHKLVSVLYKLDPRNELWKQRQIEKASTIDDISSRKAAIEAIEEAFENNELDYGRKLYLIENCIYGVDIQPIAVQIAKLRFFISLIVEQKTNSAKENLGVRPLPNLETKFVAANTLMPLEKEQVNLFTNPEIDKKKEQLKKIRRDYFESRTPRRKESCRTKDKQLREELAELLVTNNDLQPTTAKKIVAWNPYDQNTFAPFFDTEWMFGLKDGFDVVIGNPPYVEFKNLDKKIKDTLVHFKTTKGKYDLYIPFIERPKAFLNTSGILTYICPTRFLQRDYGKDLRKFIFEFYKLNQIIDFSDIQIFENATTYTGIFIFQNQTPRKSYSFTIKQPKKTEPDINKIELLQSTVSNEYIDVTEFDSGMLQNESWIFNNNSLLPLIKKIKESSVTLDSICSGIFQGIASGKDEVFFVDDKVIKEYKIERKILYPVLKGKDISPYKINWSGKYILYPYDKDGQVFTEKKLKSEFPNAYGYLKQNRSNLSGRSYFDKSNKLWFELWNQRNLERFSVEKLVTLDNASKNSFAYDKDGYLGSTTVYSIILSGKEVRLKFLLAQLNSKLLTFYHQNNTIPQAGGFYRYQAIFIKDLPIKKYGNQELFETVVNYIIHLKRQSKDSGFFERLIDAMVYELFLPDIIKTAKCEVLKHLNDLPKLKESEDEKNLKTIQKVYKEISNPEHLVSVALLKMSTLDEIAIIERKK